MLTAGLTPRPFAWTPERIPDHTNGEVLNHTRKRGVGHREIVLLTAPAKCDINWARNREDLSNAVELPENQGNSRVAREYEITLPHGLGKSARLELVRSFARFVKRKRCAYRRSHVAQRIQDKFPQMAQLPPRSPGKLLGCGG